jgi:hypothetical protein
LISFIAGAIGVLLYFLLTYEGKMGTTFDLILLDNPHAKCLDGSQGAYYISKSGDPKKFYLYFEGGGWCGDKD